MKKILRWIAVLPATVLCSVVTFALGKLFAWFVVNKFFILSSNSEDSWGYIISTALANYAAGMLGVSAGAAVAPSHKYTVSIVLTVILLCLFCISIGVESILDDFKWYQYVYMALMLVGAILGVLQVKEEERDKSNKDEK